MKFSTTFTLATITLMSVGSEARIGGGEKYEIYVSNTCHNDVTAREQNKNQGNVVKASSCKLWDSGTTESLQSFFFDTQSNKAGTGSVQCQKKPNPSECQQFMMHKKLPDNACVIKVPVSMCDDRNPKPAPAPAPPAPAPAKLEKCDHNYGGQCFHLGKDFECQNTQLALGGKPDYRCVNTKPAPAPAPPAPAKQVFTCDPQNPVNPDFDCTQKVGPGSKCQSKISRDTGDKWVYQCTELAADHHGLKD